jgi:hypothetical protein
VVDTVKMFHSLKILGDSLVPGRPLEDYNFSRKKQMDRPELFTEL